MKVFVYTKDKESKLITVLKNVDSVQEVTVLQGNRESNIIRFFIGDAEVEFPTKHIKTRIYQN